MSKELENIATEAFGDEKDNVQEQIMEPKMPDEPVEVLLSSIYLDAIENNKLIDLYNKIDSHIAYLESQIINEEDNK